MPSTSIPVIDSAGTPRAMASEVHPERGTYAPHSVPQIGGDPVSRANPMPITQAGSTGRDYSANAAALPGGAPLLTIPANAARLSVEIQNQSADDLILARDDGAGGQLSVIVLASGGGVGVQGGGWSSTTFRGRCRVYGPVGSRVAGMED